jgi:UDP-N-acetylglucosamine diphosphorylase/glucosamine-1-phosphate N-acetyltransferase
MPKDYVIVFEDEHYKGFYPISISHPTFDILAGAKTNFARIKHHFREFKIIKSCRPNLFNLFSGLTDDLVKNLSQGQFNKLILINGRLVLRKCDLDFINELKKEDDCVSYVKNDTLLAAVLPPKFIKRIAEELSSLSHDGSSQKIIEKTNKSQHVDTLTFSYIWEPMLINPKIIESDFNEYYKDINSQENIGETSTYGRDEIYAEDYAVADAASVIDSREGPVIIERGVEIKPFTYLAGPAFIGNGCKLVGGKITNGCSLGSGCRIGGELENTIIIGNSNKYHEGFIGHSYIGEWVNLGALTTNSDLANNYLEISVKQNGKITKTGSIKIGSFIGDHTKTGIGMTLNTGSVIGFSCNLFGGSLILEKEIPSFAWGNDSLRSTVRLSQAIETAEIVLKRRNFQLESKHSQMFKYIYEQSKNFREIWIKRGRRSSQN